MAPANEKVGENTAEEKVSQDEALEEEVEKENKETEAKENSPEESLYTQCQWIGCDDKSVKRGGNCKQGHPN